MKASNQREGFQVSSTSEISSSSVFKSRDLLYISWGQKKDNNRAYGFESVLSILNQKFRALLLPGFGIFVRKSLAC